MKKATITSGMPYRRVNDIMLMQAELNKIAAKHVEQGYEVSRTALGIVIVNFPDGEIHFYPDGNKIMMMTFQKAAVIEVN